MSAYALYFLETTIKAYTFCSRQYTCRSIFVEIFLAGSRTFVHFGERGVLAVQAKVDEFHANQNRVCDFLLVCNSNLGPILRRFGAIRHVLCAPVPTPIQP